MKRAYGRGAGAQAPLIIIGAFLVAAGMASFESPAAVAATKKDDRAAAASPMKGRVETSGSRRLSRPESMPAMVEDSGGANSGALTARAAGRKLQGAMDVNNFRLNTDQDALRAGLNTDIFGGPNSAFDPPPLTSHAFDQGPAQAAAAVDYAAIERVYAAAGVQLDSAPLQSALIAVRARMAGGVPGPTGAPLGQIHVDTDNCICGTAMPSRQCMGERSSTLYGGSYAGRGMAGRSAVLFGGHR